MFIFLLVVATLHLVEGYHDNDAFFIKSESLPDDLNFMPTLGNGHLGFTVYGDAIFMNGLYNGRGGDSRRARIPNWLNFSLVGMNLQRGYELNLQDGYFRSMQTMASAPEVSVEQRFYAHRFYTRALIYELHVLRLDAKAPLEFSLELRPGNASTSLQFIEQGPNLLKGVTQHVEHELFQKNVRTVFIAFSECLKDRKLFKVESGERELYYRYVITIDEREDVVLQEMQDVMTTDAHSMLELHAAEWKIFWRGFGIYVDGNLELAHTINAGIFYLASSLPSFNANRESNPYYGLSPTGLGRGNLDADYEGHNFWDTEIWMLPVVTQLAPSWSKALFQYRLRNLPGAEFNAQHTGYKGVRFPWESAFTGTEVTNPCCPEVAQQEVHITADIAFALQQFFSTTYDREWLCADAWPLVEKIATFLVNRVEIDATTLSYHIKVVMGPDEDHWNVTDNVYTNVVFKIALEFATFTKQRCDPKAAINLLWQQVAERLVVLYDPLLDYHPQHLGYQPKQQIKQADVVLLGYPLQFAMNATTRLHDLNTYEQITRPSGPAMTWSMFAINYLDVDQEEKADFYFEKSYKDYVRPEFKVWSETPIGFAGSANFLTGIGGFIQAIIAGYAGIRFERKNNTIFMEIKAMRLLPSTNELTIHGLKFANASFKVQIKRNVAAFECISVSKTRLQLVMASRAFPLHDGFKANLNSTAYVTIIPHES